MKKRKDKKNQKKKVNKRNKKFFMQVIDFSLENLN